MKPAALLSLATSATSAPLVSKRADVFDDKDAMCKNWDLRTPEGVNKLWEDTAAGASLDLFIKSQWEHEHNWVKNLEDQVQGGTSGKSGAAGCAALGTECNPMNGLSCSDQFDKYGTTPLNKNSYWTFQAVRGMHGKFVELNRQLTQETLINGLKIPQMVKDFSGSQENPKNVRSWLAISAFMGGALGGIVPGIGASIAAGFVLLGTIFNGLNVDQSEPDYASVQDALADVFRASTTKLEDTLRIATGGGTSLDEYNSLPAPKWDTYESKIAKFFNGGWFLIDDDEEVVRVTLGSISNNIQKKVANDVMITGKLNLVADKLGNANSREACGFAPGRQWLPLKNGEEYCFYIMRNNPNPNRDNEWVEATPDIYDKMASFGLGDRDTYYRALIDCALNNGNGGKPDLSNLAWGKIPRCHFNMPVLFIEHDDSAGCGDPDNIPRCKFCSSSLFSYSAGITPILTSSTPLRPTTGQLTETATLMKLFKGGASGYLGTEVVRQAVKHPGITSVVVGSFCNYLEQVKAEFEDADTCICAVRDPAQKLWVLGAMSIMRCQVEEKVPERAQKSNGARTACMYRLRLIIVANTKAFKRALMGFGRSFTSLFTIQLDKMAVAFLGQAVNGFDNKELVLNPELIDVGQDTLAKGKE
ncbi:hypothetical protein FZEAL_275 [Fusarium zealandicum]|uniref:Uncharacterized protein n=1 Tax=Fusarium zealandicum TaxID=1053134 RepID=A0A8H4XQ08_9HYPO|nr:hypothetical protein FZEAL_275 [Fusarium zealandicum]